MYKKKLLIALMLLFATACWAYNHSEVSPSGHTLYYQVNTSASFKLTEIGCQAVVSFCT